MSDFVVAYRKIWLSSRTPVEIAVSSIGRVAETLQWDFSAKPLARAGRWLRTKFLRRRIELLLSCGVTLQRP
jgi:hypothetical protein